MTLMVASPAVNAQRRGGTSSSSTRNNTTQTLRSSSDHSASSTRSMSSVRSSAPAASGTLRSSAAPVSSSTRSSSSSARSSAPAVRTNEVRNGAPSPQHTIDMVSKPRVAPASAPRYRDRRDKHYPAHRSRVVVHHYDRHIADVSQHVRIVHGGRDYYYRDGLYYHLVNGLYYVVAPPRHVHVTHIPASYFTFTIGGVPFYYSYGVYYNYNPLGYYEVVDAPRGAIVPELPEYDVNTVMISGKTYLVYDNILYKPIVTSSGVQYKVMGTFAD